MTIASAVVVSALLLAWFSFAIFLFLTLKQMQASEAASGVVKSATTQPKTDGVADIDIAKLLENAAKLVDSITKAGPGLAALAASILFLAIAGVGTGAINKPAVNAETPAAGTKAPAK